MPTLSVNTKATVALSNRLEKASRSAMPLAIRGSLNRAALQTKKVTMPKIAEETFTTRQKNFFKSFSKVEFAQGFNISSMKSTVGITPRGQQAGDDLEQQEHGGTIKSRSFIPKDIARDSKSIKQRVRPANRLGKIQFTRIRKGGKKLKSTFIARVIKEGRGKFILYGNVLYRIKSIRKKAVGRGKIKLEPLYTFKKGRTIRVKPTNFMRRSSLINAQKMEFFYEIEARKQFKRINLIK